MVEIHPRLFVGNQCDYEQNVRFQRGWRIVHACREPYHRDALGYRGRSAPVEDPEYLIALRGNQLNLNLIDADDPEYIPKEIMDRSLTFIEEALQQKREVLVHCNQGRSRGPAIGILYLGSFTDRFSGLSYGVAHDEFLNLYPDFDPAAGVRGFLVANWPACCRGHLPEDRNGFGADSGNGLGLS